MDPTEGHKQTWCISEHTNRFGPILERCGAIVSTKKGRQTNLAHSSIGRDTAVGTKSVIRSQNVTFLRKQMKYLAAKS